MTDEAPRAAVGPPQPAEWTRKIPFHGGAVTVSYDSRKWGTPETGRDGIVSLDRVAGEGSAGIVAERVGIPTERAVDSIWEDAKQKHPEAEMLCREKRTVNGQEVACLRYSLNIKTLPMILYLYVYGGVDGTVQVRTCSTAESFDRCEPDFTEFLNGLEIRPPRFPWLARAGQTVGFAGRVAIAALPVLGVALFRFGIRLGWKLGLLWTAVLAAGVFAAGWILRRRQAAVEMTARDAPASWGAIFRWFRRSSGCWRSELRRLLSKSV